MIRQVFTCSVGLAAILSISLLGLWIQSYRSSDTLWAVRQRNGRVTCLQSSHGTIGWYSVTLNASGMPVARAPVLLLDYALLVLPTAAISVAWLVVNFRRGRLPVNCCMNCGYDLRASKHCCPECGTLIHASHNSVPHLACREGPPHASTPLLDYDCLSCQPRRKAGK